MAAAAARVWAAIEESDDWLPFERTVDALQGSEAWTQMGDFTASAQLSLLHTALMQQDGELLGQGAGKEPEALCDSQFGVYANQMDTEVLMAQVSEH